MKSLVLLSLLSLFIGFSSAQSTEAQPEVRAKAMVGNIHKAVFLQGSEWTKVNDAFTAYYKEVEAAKKETSMKDKIATERKLNELKNQLNDKLSAAVGPERMRQWVAYKDKEKISE